MRKFLRAIDLAYKLESMSVKARRISIFSATLFGLCLFGGTSSGLAQEIVLQPGPTDGKDIWTTSVFSYAPGGGGPGGGLDDDRLLVGGWGDTYLSLLQFDLSSMPDSALSATLQLYPNPGSPSGTGTTRIFLDRILEFWDWRAQGTGTDRERLWWADKPATIEWDGPLSAPLLGEWYSIDITELYNAWQSGLHPNYGLQLRPEQTWNRWSDFYSADYLENPDLRPKLIVVPDNTNEPPVADAGPDQSIRAGDTVSLDGSASFDDNTTTDLLQYTWSFVSVPTGSTSIIVFSDTATPSIVADVAGSYVVRLVVTDADGLSSSPDVVEISSHNLAPTAVAGGGQLVYLGEWVTLDGSASFDPEGDLLTYDWEITLAPSGSTAILLGSDTATPGFVPDLEGIYMVTLSVSDALGPGAPDTIEVVATTAEEFAEIVIVEVDGIVGAFLGSKFVALGNQNVLENFFSQAVKAILKGDIETAIEKLEQAFIRTDGCVLRGGPDEAGPTRDWIIGCPEQEDAFPLVSDAIDALREPINLRTPLPVGLELAITQGPGTADNTHEGGDLYYSWDMAGYGFDLIDTPALAVADGEIVWCQESYGTYGGQGDRSFLGNVVTIRHNVDGREFYSSYLHLKQDSIPNELVPNQCDGTDVDPAIKVVAGQRIGLVGNTGFVLGNAAHLHLTIGRTVGNFVNSREEEVEWYQVAKGNNEDNGTLLALIDFVDSPTDNGVLAGGMTFTSTTIPQ